MLSLDPGVFSAADQEAHACRDCESPIVDVYFVAAREVLCRECRNALDRGTRSRFATRRFKCAAFYGTCAAVFAAVWIHALSKLVADTRPTLILAGLLVGLAVRFGAARLSGGVPRTIAVGLTWLAIAAAHTPLLLAATSSSLPDGDAAQRTGASLPAIVAADPDEVGGVRLPRRTGELEHEILRVAVFLTVAVMTPLLTHLHDLPGLLALLLTLYLAYRLNARSGLKFAGPLRN